MRILVQLVSFLTSFSVHATSSKEIEDYMLECEAKTFMVMNVVHPDRLSRQLETREYAKEICALGMAKLTDNTWKLGAMKLGCFNGVQYGIYDAVGKDRQNLTKNLMKDFCPGVSLKF